jgi:hypothetical protein
MKGNVTHDDIGSSQDRRLEDKAADSFSLSINAVSRCWNTKDAPRPVSTMVQFSNEEENPQPNSGPDSSGGAFTDVTALTLYGSKGIGPAFFMPTSGGATHLYLISDLCNIIWSFPDCQNARLHTFRKPGFFQFTKAIFIFPD